MTCDTADLVMLTGESLASNRRELAGARASMLVDALAGVVSDWSACSTLLQIVMVRFCGICEALVVDEVVVSWQYVACWWRCKTSSPGL